MIENVIVNINSFEDIQKMTKDTKYLNLSITSYNEDSINYFLNSGNSYSYSELGMGQIGYIYVPYPIFKEGEAKITKLISKIPKEANTLEKIRYIYIHLGKLLSIDINSIEEKNDLISLTTTSNVGNIWGSIATGKTTKKTLPKILLYIYSKLHIKCELIINNLNGTIANKVYLNDTDFIIISLADDIANIHANFKTTNFDNYNEDRELDKKVGYITDKYADELIEKALGKVSYTEENILEEILTKTSKVININSVGVYELGQIYQKIFNIYCPNYDIRINNLYISNDRYKKEHFIIISYGNEMYSFNYNKNYFMVIEASYLTENISNNNIGIYEGEDFQMRRKEVQI